MTNAEKDEMFGPLYKDSHRDSVMCIDWHSHPSFLHELVSSSADKTVKLWDLNQCNVISTFDKIHNDKIQSINLHLIEPTVLLTGSFDQTCKINDFRNMNSNDSNAGKVFQMNSSIEQCLWHPKDPRLIVACLENGYISCFDVRNESKPVFTFKLN